MYDYYKPLRNFIRQLSVSEALQHVWFYASHLSGQGKIGQPVSFPDKPGPPVKLKDTVFL
jgi:hypothetical protein